MVKIKKKGRIKINFFFGRIANLYVADAFLFYIKNFSS